MTGCVKTFRVREVSGVARGTTYFIYYKARWSVSGGWERSSGVCCRMSVAKEGVWFPE